MKFSDRLKALLNERKLTQIAFATELHIAPSTLNGYLRRNREPDYETLIKISKFFGVSTDYILGVTSIRNPYEDKKCYDDKEEDLLDTYRALGSQEQVYLIKQAHMYHDKDLDIL
ncbi:helix-turn-helix transcriptional regulator [Lachnospiraceae bacterium 29-84]